MRKKKYKVIRIIDRVAVGGPTKHVVSLCSRMDENRFTSLLVTGTAAPGETDILSFVETNDVEVEVIPEMSRAVCWKDLLVIGKLYRLFLRERPDLVHTHKSKAGAAGRIAAFMYKLTPSILFYTPRKVKTLHTFHGHVLKGYFGKWTTHCFVLIERLLARFCTDRVLVVSQQQKNELLNEFRIGRDEQFVVMRLGVEMERGETKDSGFRRRHGIGADEFVLASVGRFVPIKNLDLLLRMFASLTTAKPGLRVRLVLVGDGELRECLWQTAQSLGIADKVVFAGVEQNCLPLYREFDLLAITSNNEGTPLAMIEALSQGCAVVSTEVGGVVDLMGPVHSTSGALKICKHGVMVPAGEIEPLQCAVELLIADPALRKQTAEAGRTMVRDSYSVQRLVNEMESLYTDLLGIGPAMSQGTAVRNLSRRMPKTAGVISVGS